MAEKTILLCTIGSAGDVYPFIAIGQRVLKRGFRVVLVTSQYFESQAHDAGLEFIGLGSVDDYQTINKLLRGGASGYSCTFIPKQTRLHH